MGVTVVLALLVGADPSTKILFLGDNGHHRPKSLFDHLKPVFATRGIELTYSDKLDSLSPNELAKYDGLLIYANHTKIEPAQEKAMLDFVASGKGLIPLHCASYCFLNSPNYINLVGAQFQRHGTGVFRTTAANVDHPIMKGYSPFESWDETYVHHRHNPDRIVLEFRIQGNEKEPWTWVRTHGKGRVFYTAWGHDERTWANAGFQNLVERGTRWAIGQDPAKAGEYFDRPEMRPIAKNLKPFEYQEAELPFYPKGERWGVTAEPITKMQKPVPAEESIKHLSTPIDLEPKLFASEPDIGKAICLAFDERGRCWVAETVDYPNDMQPKGQGRDRIRICEDTNGDGKADKFTIFADKLSIPTSIAFANGGLIVHQAPETLFLKDTNGDDVCDERKVLFSGWSVSDTHAGPSNLQYGFDGWMYGIVGYAGFQGRVGGERVSFRTGFYRFKPDGSKIEFLRNTNNNSWGVGFSEDAHLFGSTANGCPSVYCGIPNRYYEAVRGWSSSVLNSIASSNKIDPIRKEIRQVDWHGGFTAGAGHALYTARVYPKYYWNRTAFVSEPTGSLTATFQIYPDGAGFRSHNSWNLVASDDEWTAPIVAEVGPDGCMWVIDWYNIIVQHNPTPRGYRTGKGAAYEIPLRDKKHGRIYRIVPTSGKIAEKINLKNASNEQLVETLKNPTMLWRMHAQRLLVERNAKDAIPSLLKLAQDKSVDEIGLNVGAIHALWTLSNLGAFEDGKNSGVAAASAKDSKSPAVRRNALLALPANDASKISLALGSLKDSDPQVRLAALLSLSVVKPNSEVASQLFAALVKDESLRKDPLLRDGLIAAAATHDAGFLEAAASATEFPDDAAGQLAIVAEHLSRSARKDAVGKLIALLGSKKSPASATIVAGLAKGWPRDTKIELDAAAEQGLVNLFDSLPGSSKSSVIALANSLGSTALANQADKISKSLIEAITNADAKDSDRIASAKQLLEFLKRDGKAAKAVVDSLDARSSPELATGILNALAVSEAKEAGTFLVAKLEELTPTARAQAVTVLMRRPEWTQALLESVDKGKASWNDFTLDQKQSLASHPNESIAKLAKTLLERGGSMPSADRQKVLEQFHYVIEKKGDAVAGKAVYKKHCAVCHRHSGEGGNVGPDLSGTAVHPKEEILVHLLDPSRSVEGNFRAYMVATADGRVINGLLASETKTAIELVDAQAKKITVLREDIEKLVASNKSLMPEGFEKQCTADELVNLMAFLSQRGKYVPLDLSKVASTTTTKGMFFASESTAERMVFNDWGPKTVDGVPFVLLDPQGDRAKNAVLLYGPQGTQARNMPRSVKVACNMPAKAIHLLSGVSGWGFPYGQKGSVSMIVRLHYADGATEDHRLTNGEHFADYIRRVDVPGSKFAFDLGGKQLRYLTVSPKRTDPIKEIEFVKGRDRSAPILFAATVEGGGH